MKNLHILRVKYLGATNMRGSRVKIISDRTKTSRTISFDHAQNSIEEMAMTELKKLGFNIVGFSEGYVVSETFNQF